jgi:hypothetical protein
MASKILIIYLFTFNGMISSINSKTLNYQQTLNNATRILKSEHQVLLLQKTINPVIYTKSNTNACKTLMSQTQTLQHYLQLCYKLTQLNFQTNSTKLVAL